MYPVSYEGMAHGGAILCGSVNRIAQSSSRNFSVSPWLSVRRRDNKCLAVPTKLEKYEQCTDAYGKTVNRFKLAPNGNAGLTQDEILEKALAFYRISPPDPGKLGANPKERILNLPPLPKPKPLKAPDGSINPEFYNRNPRNMELMNLAHKAVGWGLEAKRRDYYNKLVLEKTEHHTKAYVEHIDGRVIVSASTEELAIARHLYRNTDVSAAENIGRILGRRMLETGIIFVYSPYTEEDKKSQRMLAFLNALADSGVQMQESERIPAYDPLKDSFPPSDPDKPYR
ncbi:39S ribosomal protein L18, mitochondrial-like [Paramacrobiotus metropolitanus]|uniref:39S ribosomal protein L18, mitochondrial-like n=1 Tax=Paramacrobiotus metropolitanus TaxID=2943436 RepID=UPI0024456200|nr:39S ribosomal protein L18, mitochondrial-like [Paramacrobiotus metropolitanus]XP_055335537.1 39S ribosomal protein L18, mitochondrial-like [Paramacrobiotus metropolitanus]